jgi:hypothetical protein
MGFRKFSLSYLLLRLAEKNVSKQKTPRKSGVNKRKIERVFFLKWVCGGFCYMEEED